MSQMTIFQNQKEVFLFLILLWIKTVQKKIKMFAFRFIAFPEIPETHTHKFKFQQQN